MASISTLPEDKRILARSSITRIKDIANDLLQKNIPAVQSKKFSSIQTPGNESNYTHEQVHLIPSLIETLMSEKRFQFRHLLNVELQYQSTVSSYGLFSNIDPVEFKRMLSNLINNSVDALNEKGKVSISLENDKKFILLDIIDNGKGISPDFIRELGQKGKSFGKENRLESGSGLGLYHVRTTIERLGGSFGIESVEGQSTVVHLKLPKFRAPNWFVERIEIFPSIRIIIVDDDSSVHQIWQGRFQPLQVQNHQLEILHFSTPENFSQWMKTISSFEQNLYLIDYEFINYPQNGLDLIERLHIEDNSILVTSHYEEIQVLQKALKLKVQMIPKLMAGIVPIELNIVQERPDAILINDDHLVHMVWDNWAKSNHKKIVHYYAIKEFLEDKARFYKKTPIYIDSNLKDGIKGEIASQEIFTQGFTNLYLATAHAADLFPTLPHIKRIVSHEPPGSEKL